MLLCGKGLVLSEGDGSTRRKVEIGGEDCASAGEESRAGSAQDCKDVLCFENFGAVARDDWKAIAEDNKSVTKRKAGRTGVKDGLDEGGHDELGALHFGSARNVEEVWGVWSPSGEEEVGRKVVGI